ncbi:MAG: acyl-ACP--UDP-N-acetylglucosamine O-acyltransferase [PVC group bacterium]|nr:acyl-ACP--UDP-N-acetylglucosamine O-acyltransferase [PVC group bacterium]
MRGRTKIHPTANVHPDAVLNDDVEIGPHSIVGEAVTIGGGTKIGSSCVIDGRTTIGKNCQIFTGAVIGSIPQDLKYKGEDTEVCIGDNNIIREYVTINLGTDDHKKTIIGNKNLFMAYSHIAHDCIVGNENVIANVGTLAGHVTVTDKVVLGGLTAVHQFVKLGQMSIIGGCSKVVQDIPPFSMVDGHPARVYGINNIGLQRANVSQESISRVKMAFKILFKMKLSMTNALKRVESEIPQDQYVSALIEFIKSSERGVCKGN